jgi:hypothetical protein
MDKKSKDNPKQAPRLQDAKNGENEEFILKNLPLVPRVFGAEPRVGNNSSKTLS